MPRRRATKKRTLTKEEKKQVVRLIHGQAEQKYVNLNPPQFIFPIIPYVSQLSIIPQGDSDNMRNGDRLKFKYMQFRLFIHKDPNSATAFHFNRFIIFQWKPSISPVASDILLLGVTGTVNYTSQYNHDKRQLYKILYDKTFTTVGFDPQGTVGGVTDKLAYTDIRTRINIPWKDPQYDVGTTIGTNQIYQLYVGTSAGSDSTIGFYTVKIFFDDI